MPACLTLCVLASAADARGQSLSPEPPQNVLQQQRLIDEKLADERLRLEPIDALFDWQWGGWIESYTFHFQDGFQRQRVLQRPSLVLWTRLTADRGIHEVFARVRLTYEVYNHGDAFKRGKDWIGPNLDRGWYRVDLSRAFGWTHPGDAWDVSLRIGRQQVIFGTGLALDMPLDAVVLDTRAGDWYVIGLFARTIASFPNIDRSLPVESHSARRFFGVQVRYDGFDRHEPFAYALWNDDFTDERPKDPFQKYAYDTQYFGLGSRGELAHNLDYHAEFVYETGHSYGDGDFASRDRVRAWAWSLGLEKRWDHETRPRVAFEYLFASGDRDRIFSPTNAAGGNMFDRTDTSFVGFGYRDTGLSAAPALSNIHIFKLGGSFRPLPRLEAFEQFELGANTFLYYKHHRRAAISDPSAGQFSGYVGWELDTFVNWRLASDLSLTVRWGMFFPGRAYRDRSSRSFLLTGLTWSF